MSRIGGGPERPKRDISPGPEQEAALGASGLLVPVPVPMPMPMPIPLALLTVVESSLSLALPDPETEPETELLWGLLVILSSRRPGRTSARLSLSSSWSNTKPRSLNPCTSIDSSALELFHILSCRLLLSRTRAGCWFALNDRRSRRGGPRSGLPPAILGVRSGLVGVCER